MYAARYITAAAPLARSLSLLGLAVVAVEIEEAAEVDELRARVALGRLAELVQDEPDPRTELAAPAGRRGHVGPDADVWESLQLGAEAEGEGEDPLDGVADRRVLGREEASVEDADGKGFMGFAEGVDVRQGGKGLFKALPFGMDAAEGEVGVESGDDVEELCSKDSPRMSSVPLQPRIGPAVASDAARESAARRPVGVSCLESPPGASQLEQEVHDGFVGLQGTVRQ